MAQAQSGQIDVETGRRASHYVDAVTTPADDQPCTVLLSVARLGTLEPVTDGFQLAIDTDLAVDKATPDYNTDWGVDGRMTFSGGHLREVTADLKAGILTLSNAPKYFQVEMSSGQLV